MKRKLMALMLARIMVIQSAGTSWAAEFTDGVNVEYGDSSENRYRMQRNVTESCRRI